MASTKTEGTQKKSGLQESLQKTSRDGILRSMPWHTTMKTAFVTCSEDRRICKKGSSGAWEMPVSGLRRMHSGFCGLSDFQHSLDFQWKRRQRRQRARLPEPLSKSARSGFRASL